MTAAAGARAGTACARYVPTMTDGLAVLGGWLIFLAVLAVLAAFLARPRP